MTGKVQVTETGKGPLVILPNAYEVPNSTSLRLIAVSELATKTLANLASVFFMKYIKVEP